MYHCFMQIGKKAYEEDFISKIFFIMFLKIF